MIALFQKLTNLKINSDELQAANPEAAGQQVSMSILTGQFPIR
jgi:hypothetical protein